MSLLLPLLQDRTIFRFSATPALLLLGPFHFLRRLALRVLTHKLFALLVFFTVVTNCVVLLLPEKEYYDHYWFFKSFFWGGGGTM